MDWIGISHSSGVQVGDHNEQHNHYQLPPPAYRLSDSTARPRRPVGPLRPAELLDAGHEVVPFFGREEEQRSLWRWLTAGDGESDRAVRLFHGPGGQGKTRLAAQFAGAARTAGWDVLLAHRDPRAAEPAPRLRRGAAGLLVVVDYADRWPVNDLRSLVTDSRLHRQVPVRMLLLARSAGYWWQAQRYWLSRLGIAVDEHELTALAADDAARKRLFRTAVDRFAALIPRSRAGTARRWDLTGLADGTALTVELAALVAVVASREAGTTPAATVEDMYGYLLDREVEHWRQLFVGGAVTSPPEQLDRAVFAATLAGPVSYEAGELILGMPGVGAGPVDAPTLRTDHARCYPPRSDASALEPLQPDRLGESYLALALPGHGRQSFPAKPWAPGVVRALLRGAGLPAATAAEVRADTLRRLVEVAADWRHVRRTLLVPLLRDGPALAVAAGGAVLARIIDLPDVDDDLLAAIEPVLPTGRHVDFDNVARDVVGRLHAARLTPDPGPVRRAELHIAYGRRLAFAGDREAALDQLELAVAAGEQARSAAASAETSALLARALHLRGHRLADLNRYPAALVSAERAVALLTSLVGEGVPVDHRPALAEALDSLATRLSNLQRHQEAEAVSQQAVALFGGMPLETTAELVGLAGALANLAVIQAHLGETGRALGNARRAERIWRGLSDAEPAVYRPDLAAALNTVGLRHAELGQLDEAARVGAESEQILRELVRVNPVAFELRLAAVLANLSGYLWQLHRRVEALELNAEAERIFVRWNGTNSPAFHVHLRRVRENIAAMRAKQSPVDLRRWELGANSFQS
ncbi:tetratricopeptide repeat protein [Micromonospora sp. PLK6-60]|uniref:tetratricopeptide repeat protein n=1 Tax=Micromonospora sp. PLK6-60 TaxID=2873383 RepID=UPI001CA6A2B1|nr:tetratricopeptide repeat protein [Micromonospora sp. PLK6-60]MBY8873210.1 tetratricopeptide repeat protein [Micromonospora sp. PLK6-60]